MPNINSIYYLITGSICGTLAQKTGIPAAPYLDSLIDPSIHSIRSKVDMEM